MSPNTGMFSGPVIIACKHQSTWETMAFTLLFPDIAIVLLTITASGQRPLDDGDIHIWPVHGNVYLLVGAGMGMSAFEMTQATDMLRFAVLGLGFFHGLLAWLFGLVQR